MRLTKTRKDRKCGLCKAPIAKGDWYARLGLNRGYATVRVSCCAECLNAGAKAEHRPAVVAMLQGISEAREDLTTHYGAGLIEAYDTGRTIGRRALGIE